MRGREDFRDLFDFADFSPKKVLSLALTLPVLGLYPDFIVSSARSAPKVYSSPPLPSGGLGASASDFLIKPNLCLLSFPARVPSLWLQ